MNPDWRPEDALLSQAQPWAAVGLAETATNLLLAALLGVLVARGYQRTHRGLSYSVSFVHTVVFVALIAAMVMMVIGNSLSRAFALVGALSIVRFRTVVKETRDTAFVFMALAAGMAAGTSNYMLAVLGTVAFLLAAMALHRAGFGRILRRDYILQVLFASSADKGEAQRSTEIESTLQDHAEQHTLLRMEPSNEGGHLCTYDLDLARGQDLHGLVQKLENLEGVAEVVALAGEGHAAP